MSNENEKPRPFHEVVPEVLKPLVFHFKGEKADFAFGGLVTILGVFIRTIIPHEHVLEIIRACDFVIQALELLEKNEVPTG